MKNTYIELGINPRGTILVLAPVVKGRQFSPTSMMLSDLERKGMADSTNMIGQMLFVALGSFHPEIKRYRLRPPPPLTPPFPTHPPPGEPRGAMRGRRTGLGFVQDTKQAMLFIRNYENEQPFGQESRQSLNDLEQVGTTIAPSLIGTAMLRKLADMHPDVTWLQAI